MSFLHADYAESAEFFIFFSVLRWRWRGRKLRYDERAQRRERLVFSFNLSVPYTFPFALPSVALGSAPLRGHRMTFGHSSKDPLRPLSQRDSQYDVGASRL